MCIWYIYISSIFIVNDRYCKYYIYQYHGSFKKPISSSQNNARFRDDPSGAIGDGLKET